ncbi:alpha/beta hydrolase [Nitratireductor sp. ZSWI3]|uniref:alpha/beta hydrolase n=1 Tax=Nitratireductor sp. ZSWI3 TaxID=2966359 RepID=UPI00214FA8E2|nr:alpha/beta hydrolase [Nitratireductor sp. ZSWI3]MCR4265053.1 alpha/beta hydrolase [Nitratireductor sp. ZSWI3]
MGKALVLSALAAVLMTSAAHSTDVRTRQVSFESDGETLVGTLYVPAEASASAKLPGILVTGSWTSVKEQMPGLYAREMAERGFAALAFDFRGWGESEGDVRFKEDPAAKTADIMAAAEYMTTLPEIDSERIGGLGICASAGYMADAAASHATLKSVSLVAPWLHNAEIVEQVYGGADGVANLIETSREAEAAEANGDAQIIVAASTTDETSLMYQVPYYTETDRGLIPQYDNKFNLASWEPWLTYDSVVIGGHLRKPTLVVHSEAAAVPQGAHAFLELLGSAASELWLDNVSQFDFYDQPDPVKRAADAAADHFGRTLNPGG